ncbi:hypothetical protein BACPU_23480 [Bacillus pumilus]|nr:hypothetical protein BACPU_23480 [Bacillus pumilus]
MIVTVALLYSTQSFLELITRHKMSKEVFINSYVKYLVAIPESIVELSVKCKWIDLDEKNDMEVTALGKEIINSPLPTEKLRIQLEHYILIEKPTWFLMMHYGRIEAARYFPTSIYQCFKEADLFDSISTEVIDWWDHLSSISRNESNKSILEIGRLGEKLSFFYEKNRIASKPHWQSIDSNFSGYDILSKIEKDNDTNLKIEVKASINKYHFFLTKNEWKTAIGSNQQAFHLWVFEPSLELYIFTSDLIKTHVPTNTERGNWESCHIQLSANDLSPFKVVHNLDINNIKEQEI